MGFKLGDNVTREDHATEMHGTACTKGPTEGPSSCHISPNPTPATHEFQHALGLAKLALPFVFSTVTDDVHIRRNAEKGLLTGAQDGVAQLDSNDMSWNCSQAQADARFKEKWWILWSGAAFARGKATAEKCSQN